ncbi:MAG: hypothetical protein LBK76_00530 [Verrucomicrobiales bacterium]|jgi:hypothetical protein|nr:hypothetical protein [Verrucomicrobiales bacterium]
MEKSLDRKIASILADPAGSKEFIIADAKDADMAFGLAAPGRAADGDRWKTLAEYREQIRAVVRQGLVDIMLCSASTIEQLAIKEQLFADSQVTPAARANDSSDIWAARGGRYPSAPSRPFRSATIDHIKYGRLDADHVRPFTGADLGLYSMTFTNNLERDHETLAEFKKFREEAERKKFRYFLEVFDPNVDAGLAPADVPAFVNDQIVRSLAGVTVSGRPLFLKMVYHGPRALEELAAYDPTLIVGILGGAAGTTYDAFKLIAEARQHGARVALFGRKINCAEDPLTFIEMLRRIVSGELSPEEAVRAYHGALTVQKIRPLRPLAEDSQLTANSMSYGG